MLVAVLKQIVIYKDINACAQRVHTLDESIQDQDHGQQHNSEITYNQKNHLKSPPGHLG